MSTPKSFTFSNLQKTLLGISLSFLLIYKFVLKDPDIIKGLGVGYAGFLMIWIMVMVTCAGLSGRELGLYILEIIKDKLKDRLKGPEE